jgi:hypothetical protein
MHVSRADCIRFRAVFMCFCTFTLESWDTGVSAIFFELGLKALSLCAVETLGMEPLHTVPMKIYKIDGIDEEDTDILKRNDNLEDINSKTQDSIRSLKLNILKFKKILFEETVSNDTAHSPSGMEAMIGFQSRFLHMVSFWLSLLNEKQVPLPKFESTQHTNMFIRLTRQIQELAKQDSDAYVLTYSLLFQFTQQHPFDMGGLQNADSS